MGTTLGSPSPFFDLLHLDIRYPIARRIYHFLGIVDIIAVSQTCRSLENVYRSLLPLEWNIDRVLSRFFSDPKRFRSQMAKCNVLAGGSVPLQYFERLAWRNEPLHLYQAQGPYETSMEDYLKDVEGYTLLPIAFDAQRPPASYLFPGSTRLESRSSSNARITIITTTNPPIETILDNMKSTVLTSCFSWNKAYSIYPLITHIRYEAFVYRNLIEELLKSHVEAYKHRGWKFGHQPRLEIGEDGTTNSPIRLTRRVGDRFTWKIPFDTKGIDHTEAQPDSVLDFATFSVKAIDHNVFEGIGIYYDFRASSHKTAALKYTHTFGYDGWYNWLKKILRYKTLEELHNLNPADRPETFETMVSNPENVELLLRDFEKPELWHYCDEEIPKLYGEWTKMYGMDARSLDPR